jgi:LPS-assembly lipoprotein
MWSSEHRAARRRALRVAAALAPAGLLAACGFHLRQPPVFAFRRIALTGFTPRSPLADELKAQLLRSGLVVDDDPAKAEVVLQALTDLRDRRVVATTTAAQVREVQLRLRLRWRTQTPAGRELSAPAELALVRDLSYSESVALAKQHEEDELYRDMQADIVGQVLRRLAAVHL